MSEELLGFKNEYAIENCSIFDEWNKLIEDAIAFDKNASISVVSKKEYYNDLNAMVTTNSNLAREIEQLKLQLAEKEKRIDEDEKALTELEKDNTYQLEIRNNLLTEKDKQIAELKKELELATEAANDNRF